MQVVSALKYLNEIKPPVIHYDLKPGMYYYLLVVTTNMSITIIIVNILKFFF